MTVYLTVPGVLDPIRRVRIGYRKVKAERLLAIILSDKFDGAQYPTPVNVCIDTVLSRIQFTRVETVIGVALRLAPPLGLEMQTRSPRVVPAFVIFFPWEKKSIAIITIISPTLK